jgi:hypothetical protein
LGFGFVRRICGLLKSILRVIPSIIGKILRPKPTARKGVLALLLVLAIIASSNESKVVRLSEYEVRDRSFAPLESQLGVDPQDVSAYSAALTTRLVDLRESVTVNLKTHISDEQARRSNIILGVLVGLSFTGLLLVLSPIPLARSYPNRKSVLVRFSWLSALLFIIVGNVFVGIYALTRITQTIVSTASNPQLSLTESTFNFLIVNSDELASVGPGIIEPTLRAMENDPAAPALDSIINNVYIFTGEVGVYQTILNAVEITAGIFSFIPLVVLLVAFALVLRNAIPTMKAIIRLPGDAANGVEQAGRTTINATARSIGHELIYAFALIGVLLAVTFAIAATGTSAIEPALQVVLNYLLASIV